MKGFFGGFLAAGFFAALCVAVLGTSAIAKKRSEAKHGWNLRPIVVFAQDVPAGTVVTFDQISQRSMPEQFVTASAIRPDEASILVGKTLRVDMLAGDTAEWQALVKNEGSKRTSDCAAAIAPTVKLAADRARESATEAFMVAAGSPEDTPPAPLPPVGPTDADGNVMVVVITQELAEGTVLTAAHLAERAYPVDHVTPSMVPRGSAASIIGALVAVPLVKGDAIRWQFLDSAKQPRSPVSCERRALEASSKAAREAAVNESNAWSEREGK